MSVQFSLAGPVATVTLSRPESLNAQTPETWSELARIGESLPPEIRVVLVRGEGRSFSAGLDRAVFGEFDAMARLPESECDALIERYQAGFSWLRRADIVSIAVVAGHAIGAGFQLALACDLRLVAEDAQFSMAETRLGLVPDLTGTTPLVELVGYSRALEICLTGRRVGAAEAARLGLATVVVPLADLDAAVEDLVAALLSSDAEAVRETKALLLGASARSEAEQRAAERSAQGRRLRALARNHAASTGVAGSGGDA